MALSALHPQPLPSIRSGRLLLLDASPPPAALDLHLGGAKSRSRGGGRKRRNTILPSIDANALRRAAASLAANLIRPPRRESPSDLLLLLGGDGRGTGGGRGGFWGGGWFGGWGRRRRGTWLIELLVSIAVAVALGRMPVEPALLGFNSGGRGVSRRAIEAVALGFLVCFVMWWGLRRRRRTRRKWISWRW